MDTALYAEEHIDKLEICLIQASSYFEAHHALKGILLMVRILIISAKLRCAVEDL